MPIYIINEDEVIQKPKNSKEYHKWEEQQKYFKLKAINDKVEEKAKEYGYHIPEKTPDLKNIPYANIFVEIADHQANKAQGIYANGHILERKKLQLPIVQVETQMQKILDPAFIIKKSDFETLDLYFSFVDQYDIVLGGELKSIKPSPLSLPPKVQHAVNNEVHEYRMASYTPLIVSIKGKPNYILPAFATWGKWGEKTGNMIDEAGWKTAPVHELPRPHLEFRDDIKETLVIVEDF
jgi:hypothetical protein